MKKWLYLTAALAAFGILSRLPHPARDIADLEPVRTVWIYRQGGQLHLETDTADHGAGGTLTEAAEDLKTNADAELFLDTAEFLVLDPEVPITEEFYDLLRPDCKVVITDKRPDLETVSDFLSVHPPELTMAKLRNA